MKLSEIRTLVYKALGIRNDDVYAGETIDQYGQSIDEFINQGYSIVCTQKYRPKRTQRVTLIDGKFSLSELDGDVTTLISISDCGCGVGFAVDGDIVTCNCGCCSVVDVTYEYAPERLRNNTDEPIFKPEITHGILASYAVYAMLSRLGGESSEKAMMHKAAFAEGLANVRPHMNGSGQYSIKNQFRL